MPTPKELLAEFLKSEGDTEKLAELVHTDAPSLFNHIHGSGFNAGKGKAEKEIKTLKDSLAEKDTALAAKDDDIDAAKSTVTKEVEQRLQNKITSLEKKLADKETEIRTRDERIANNEKEGALNQFQEALVKAGLRPKDAERYRLKHADLFTRNANGELEILQPGSKTPYPMPVGDQKAFDALVKHIDKNAEPDERASKVGSGGGQIPGAQHLPNMPGDKKFDPMANQKARDSRPNPLLPQQHQQTPAGGGTG